VSSSQYEFNMVMDLLRKGHPNPDSKVCVLQAAWLTADALHSGVCLICHHTPSHARMLWMQIGSGVRAIQIKRHQEMESTCYFVMRSDGTQEDFSYRKCIAKLVCLAGTCQSDSVAQCNRERGPGG
jgi:Protein of unknown function (DUF3223)